MFKRMNPIVAIALCGLTLSLLTAPRAHADANVLHRGRITAGPFVNLLIDDDSGTDLDNTAAPVVQAQYAGTEWQLRADGQFFIMKGDKVVLGPVLFFTNQKHSFFFLHSRSAKQTVDGRIDRWGDKLENGWAQLFVTEASDDGKSYVTMTIEVNLSFQ